jgi:hypothetical protein
MAASPVALLEQQVRLLTDLCAQQNRQHQELIQQLERLRLEQTQQSNKLAIAVKTNRPAASIAPGLVETQPVEVVGFNMPYLGLVGFIIKFYLAHLPAVVLLFVIGVVLFLLLGGSLGLFGTLLSNVR